MGIIDSFIDGVKNGQAELANYHMNFDQAGGGGKSAIATDDGSEIAVYNKGNVSWVNIALNRKMLDVGNRKYFMVDKDNKKIEWKNVPDEYKKAFEDGYGGSGLSDMIAGACGQEDLAGNGLWIKNTEANLLSKAKNRVDELIPITPGNFKVNLNSRKTAVLSYDVRWGDGTKSNLLPEQVIHFKRNEFLSGITPLIGIGLISQGRSLINYEQVAMDYQTTFLEQDGTPDLIYIDKTTMNHDMAKSKQKELNSSYKNKKYSNGVMYAHGDVDIKSFALSSNDLQFIENRQMNKGQIISLMESTNSVLGDESGAGNFAIAKNATLNYYKIVNSRASHLVETINKQFIWMLNGNDTRKYSLSFTPYPVGDIDELTKSVNGGLLTPADASRNLGYDFDEKDEASNALYIGKGVGTMQSNFETEAVNVSGFLSDEIESIKKKTLIRDYQ